MKKDRFLYPIVPTVIILSASVVGIVFGVLPYIKKDLIYNISIMQIVLLGCGTVCFISTLLIMFKPGKISEKAMAVEEKEKEPSVRAVPPPPQKPVKTDNAQAVLLLSLLQEKGRFLDFVMGDISSYNNEQIGAAARFVHQGCNELIKDCFEPEAISSENENSEITLDAGFNSRKYKIVGDVVGEPPYNGKLVHKGWKANHVKLPLLSLPQSQSDTPVLQPVEIEL
jgi:hypothetical protein